MSLYPTLAPHPPKGAKRPLSPAANRPVKDERSHPNFLEDAVRRALRKTHLLRQIADYTKEHMLPRNGQFTDKELQDAVSRVLHGVSSRQKAQRSSTPTSEAPPKRPRTNEHHITSPTNNGLFSFQAMPPAPGTQVPSVAPAPIIPENNERIADWYENTEDRLGGVFTGNPSTNPEPLREKLTSDGEFVIPPLPQSTGFRAVNSASVQPPMSTTTIETENHYQPSIGSMHSSLLPITLGGGTGNTCEFCAKSLNSPSAKQEHESVHVKELSGYRRYACPLQCDYKHIRARDVLMHLRKKHAQPPKIWQLREVKDNGALSSQEWEKLKRDYRERKENNPIKFVHQDPQGNGMPSFSGKSRAPPSTADGHHLNTSMAPASHSRTVISHHGLDTHMGNTAQVAAAAPGSNIGELLELPPTMDDPWDYYQSNSVDLIPAEQMSTDLLEGLGSSFPADMLRYSSYAAELDVDAGTQSTQPGPSQNYASWSMATV